MTCAPAASPDNATAVEYFQKGAAAYQKGDLHGAAVFFENTINNAPEYAPAYHALGLVFRDQGEPLSQITWYMKKAIDLNPEYLAAYEDLGKVYQMAGSHDESIFYFEELLKKDPDRLAVHFSLAWIYLLAKGEPHPGAEHFEAVLKQSKIPKAYYGLGLAYSMMREPARVLEIITELKALKENDLAAKLEEALRKPYSPQPSAAIPVLPTARTESILVPQAKPTPPPPPSYETPIGTTRVRLRGKLYPILPGQ